MCVVCTLVLSPFTLPHLDERKAGLAYVVTDLACVCTLLIERLAAAVVISVVGAATLTPVPPD